MKGKYRYVTETCGECGHKHLRRVIIKHLPAQVIVKDFSKIISDLQFTSPTSDLLASVQRAAYIGLSEALDIDKPGKAK